MTKKIGWILIGLLLLKLVLGFWGIFWGLPDRWNTDEQVADTLTMMANKTLYSPNDTTHPTFHKFTLAFLFLIYLGFLQLTGQTLTPFIAAGSISWLNLAQNFPNFSTNIYLIARGLSVFCGLLSVYLIYLVAKLIFDNKTVALFSAATLTLNVGFNAENHFAKATSLDIVLVLVVCYFCLRALKGAGFLKNFLIASFFTGLAFATKWDGGIAILFLIVSYFLHFNSISLLKGQRSVMQKVKWLFNFKTISLAIFFCFLGAFIGWPDGFLAPQRYFGSGNLTVHLPSLRQNLFLLFFEQIKIYSVVLLKMFGIPLAIFALISFIKLLFWRDKYPKELLMIIIMLICYFLVAIFAFTKYKGGNAKFIMLSVPFLSLFAALGLKEFWQLSRLNIFLRSFLVAGVVLYSLFYICRSNSAFSNDTRYESTRWILENIKNSQTLEHLQEPDLLYSASKIFNKVENLYYGRSSRSYDSGKSFYKWSEDCLSYLKKMDKEGSRSDYFIAAGGGDFLLWPKEITPKTEGRFLFNLISGKEKQYVLAKKFVYGENLWFNPRPTYTCPEIYIFIRRSK